MTEKFKMEILLSLILKVFAMEKPLTAEKLKDMSLKSDQEDLYPGLKIK